MTFLSWCKLFSIHAGVREKGISVIIARSFHEINGISQSFSRYFSFKRKQEGRFLWGAAWSLHFRGIKIYIIDYAIWFEIWHSITFPSSQINLSQIHSVKDGNGFYRSLCYNSILQLIPHSLTHFLTIKIQHISMSLVCISYTTILT